MQVSSSDIDRIRARPNIYLGAPPTNALILLWGLLANSVDEHDRGHCSHISVRLRGDGAVILKDNGRGIPFQTRNGVCATTLILTSMPARFGDSPPGPLLHPELTSPAASLVTVNALSAWLEFTTMAGGRRYFQHFDRGIPRKPMRFLSTTAHTGLVIAFLPDPSFFTSPIPLDAVRLKVRDLSSRLPALTIDLSAEPSS